MKIIVDDSKVAKNVMHTLTHELHKHSHVFKAKLELHTVF